MHKARQGDMVTVVYEVVDAAEWNKCVKHRTPYTHDGVRAVRVIPGNLAEAAQERNVLLADPVIRGLAAHIRDEASWRGDRQVVSLMRAISESKRQVS